MARHWSFVVCDEKYLYPLVSLLLVIGIAAAVFLKDPEQICRIGNFIMGIGIWMSMRSTFREGINRNKDYADSSSTIPGTNQINANFFNKITFSIGDAQLQIRGFIIVIFGSIISSYGDIIFSYIASSAALFP